MIRLTMLPGEDGDCLLLEWGDEAAVHRMLIDGGRAGSYDRVKEYLATHVGDAGLDVVVLTHVDQDHILGVLKLFDDPDRVPVRDVWFNGFNHLTDTPFESFGGADGELLTTHLLTGQIPWNRAFGTRAIEIGRTPIAIDDETKITILSPTRELLEGLVPSWEANCLKHGLLPGQDPKEPGPAGFEAFGDDVEDVSELDIVALADERFTRDSSRANRSSIAFLFEHHGIRLLFTGDADDPQLVTAVTELLGDGEARLRLDTMKVAHHGSRKNLSRELLDLVACDCYLISTSGARHSHPDPVAMARILVHGGDDKDVVFNYRERAELWDDEALRAAHGYRVIGPDGEDGITTLEWRPARTSGRSPG